MILVLEPIQNSKKIRNNICLYHIKNIELCFAFYVSESYSDSDIYYYTSKLLKERIAIPSGMKKNDVICEGCYPKSLYILLLH